MSGRLIECGVVDVDQWASPAGRTTDAVLLRPEPTVYSSHIMMATTDAACRRSGWSNGC